MAFVWQAFRQEDTLPQYSEDPTLTQHVLVKLTSVYVTTIEKNHTEVTVSEKRDSL